MEQPDLFGIEKTEWFDGDVPPERDGEYEWENSQEYFDAPIVPEWRTHHWIVRWKTITASGTVVCSEAPCRWRGLANPPASVLLEF